MINSAHLAQKLSSIRNLLYKLSKVFSVFFWQIFLVASIVVKFTSISQLEEAST